MSGGTAMPGQCAARLNELGALHSINACLFLSRVWLVSHGEVVAAYSILLRILRCSRQKMPVVHC